jgi:hypothetical protein
MRYAGAGEAHDQEKRGRGGVHRRLPRRPRGGVQAEPQAACRAWGRPEGRGVGPGEVGGDAWSGQELEVAPGMA